MKRYTFWNNKGGTGKTSLCFQCLVRYSELHPKERILVIDLCPQANLSELLLGGLMGNGSSNLSTLYNIQPWKSIGGYFDFRIYSPFTKPNLNINNFISCPNSYNPSIPQNVRLIAGDNIVEIQATYMSTFANSSLPNQSAYALTLKWLSDLLVDFEESFDIIFIDCNPSFSIYTQIGITASEKLIIPVMADDSSRRALQNVFSLVYGMNTIGGYQGNSYNTIALKNGLPLPKIHLVLKNRITQYMGSTSGYRAVLQSIDDGIQVIHSQNPLFFTHNWNIEEVRDFQTTGVIAFAEAKTFATLINEPLTHIINGQRTTLNRDYVQQYIDNVDRIVAYL